MIEAVSTHNLHELLPLMRAYQQFYQAADISDEENHTFLSQFGEKSDLGCQFLYRQNGVAVGFATVYFSFSSTIASKVGVLNDLFITPAARRQGIATELIEHCKSYAATKGAARLQWVTALDNMPAKQLYNSLPTGKSAWDFYTYNL